MQPQYRQVIAESGKVKPVIDRKYSFEQMAEANMYVEPGHKERNVVIAVGQSSK